ncbi:MAG: sodium/proton antiporter NhaB [Cellvibrionaceae bacterium]
MNNSLLSAFGKNFLGQAPDWYKQVIIAFLVVNPILLMLVGPFVTGWVIVGEFIFTLAMALKCYPLQPGGLIAIETIALGIATTEGLKSEVEQNFAVILLLIFMVAGIYFMKDLLLFVFTKILIRVRNKILLSLLFSFVAAVLSAFLDALTVTAVLISVGVGFYAVYHKVASGKKIHIEDDHDHSDDSVIHEYNRSDLDQFRAFLRSLIMHGAVGTALGGVCTQVGEPQNLLIAEKLGWNFIEFFLVMAPITIPVLFAGLACCALLEKTKILGYGYEIPEKVREVLEDFEAQQNRKRTTRQKAELVTQGIVAIILCVALSLHIAEVGFIGLMIIVLQTAFNGVIEEHQIGHAFEEALPFTALLVVFFVVVSAIHEQHLFSPVTNYVLSLPKEIQPAMLFVANGILSMISDNVFVATVYINEVHQAMVQGTIDREHYEKLAVAINTGTNIPSVATPNGQAAFLFLLTSALAPLLRLSYGRMVIMAFPYMVVMSSVALAIIINQ